MESGAPPPTPPDPPKPPTAPSTPISPPPPASPTPPTPASSPPGSLESKKTADERPRASTRRQRHRDLPARVRRRQAIAAAVIVVLLGFGLIKVISAVFGGGDEKSKAAAVPLEKLVGQTVVGKLPSSGPDPRLLKRVRLGQIGGVIVNPGSPRGLKQDTAKLQQAAAAGGNPPLIVAIDQEGGPVKRLPGPPKQSPAQLGKLGDENATRTEGEDTGKFLADLGVNVDLAPDADVSHPRTAKTLASRSFGGDPGEVAKQVVAFAEGLGSGGTGATVKHFPGLGFSKSNTDVAAAKITAPRGVLESDIEPFQAAIDNGVPLVMTSTAIYTAFDAQNPAAWSKPIVGDELRDKLGFDGVVITDDLEGAAVRKQMSPDKAALASLLAGGDQVLFAKSAGASAGAYTSLLRAAKGGQLSRDTLEASYERILRLKDGFGG